MLRYFPAIPNDDLLRTPDMLRRWEEHLLRTLGTLLVVLAYSSLLFIRLSSGHEAHWVASVRRDLFDLKIGINGFNPSIARTDGHTRHVTMRYFVNGPDLTWLPTSSGIS